MGYYNAKTPMEKVFAVIIKIQSDKHVSPLAKVVTFISKGSKSDFAKTEHLPSGVKCSQLCEFSLESLEIFFQVIKKVV